MARHSLTVLLIVMVFFTEPEVPMQGIEMRAGNVPRYAVEGFLGVEG